MLAGMVLQNITVSRISLLAMFMEICTPQQKKLGACRLSLRI